ncbi:MAG: hypothetical protein B6D59_05365 [Campylobacteraceae bacterium 4484_4]|nr:MAG: hypothetical protein B6D59_05365 [Campylobacteraceae bacterium 4484_4]
MQKVGRILVVLNECGMCDEVIKKSAELAKHLKAGVTILYVREEALFELPIYHGEQSDLESVRKKLKSIAKEAGLENVAVFVYENDTIDRVSLEAERENDTLIITAYTPKLSYKLCKKAPAPVLVLKKAKTAYAKAVVSIDSVAETKRCLTFVRELFPRTALHLYQDYQYFSQPIADPFVDPMIEPYDMSMDLIENNEMIQARKEAFYKLCEEEGVEGTFLMGEKTIDQNIAAFVSDKGADLLVVDLLDGATLLAMALEDILEKTTVDTLVCREQ